MVSQLSTNGEALRLFFTEDIYFVNEAPVDVTVQQKPAVLQPDAPAVSAVTPASTAKVEHAALDFKYLGKNRRNILILVNDDQHEVSNETGRELLRKIVKSVNLTAEDFALLNYAKYRNSDFTQLKRFFNCNILFAFGVAPSQLSLPGHPQNTIVSEGEVRIVFTTELPVLSEDANGKKALWGCLRNLEI